MNQNTTIQTKKEFLEMLNRAIGDDDVILWTSNLNTVELKPKSNEKRITFGLAADAFKQKSGVGDLIHLHGILFGAVVCDRSILSEGANGMLPIKEKPTKKKKP